jgi:hypothetical protein
MQYLLTALTVAGWVAIPVLAVVAWLALTD